MSNQIPQMKWWGWGYEHQAFDAEERPGLKAYIQDYFKLTEFPKSPPIHFDLIQLPSLRLNEAFCTELTHCLAAEQISWDKKQRLVHAYGKSFRDLFRVRRGQVDSAPDWVVFPRTEEDVQKIVLLAQKYNVIIIPFGGGSNIAGCVEARQAEGRMVVSLDLKLMDKILFLDRQSHLARIQAGALGPLVEEGLLREGFTMGHFPDSFKHSTLGGWIATRSAGMQSDQFGKIEDMVVAVKMITPKGTIMTLAVPRASNGIDVKNLCVGSEGILGVITEATVRIRKVEESKEIYGFIFPTFEDGVAAIEASIRRQQKPLLTRLNDYHKTALSVAFKSKSSPLQQFMQQSGKRLLALKGIDSKHCCLMVVGFNGSKKAIGQKYAQYRQLCKEFNGVAIGNSPGKTFEKTKYDFPFVRDYVMDFGFIADVSETATTWRNLLPLYYRAYKAIEDAISQTGSKPWVGCHISHSYENGASLYFTYVAEPLLGSELQQYLFIKQAVEKVFVTCGATVSHHHAVGYEHSPWLKSEVTETGILALSAIKQALDPKKIMNPGKMLTDVDGLKSWGLDPIHFETFNQGVLPNLDSQKLGVVR